jgi:hypothetical protein
MVYADDMNLLGNNTETIKKNVETFVDTSKEVGLEVNVEKTKYMLVSRDQNAGQNGEIQIANRSFKCITISIFENNSDRSKFYLGGNLEETEFW